MVLPPLNTPKEKQDKNFRKTHFHVEKTIEQKVYTGIYTTYFFDDSRGVLQIRNKQ